MRLYFIALVLFGLASNKILAEDIEIYTGSASNNDIPPNVVFIFDTSGSMGTSVGGGQTRLSLTKRAAIETINGLSNINMTLMQFDDWTNSSHYGGYFNLPMKSVDDNTHKQDLINQINSYNARSWTPATETLYEAARFFMGENMTFGGGNTNNGYYYASHSGTRSGRQYDTPIVDQCQKNHIVLFTDGASTYDGGANTAIQNLTKTIPADERTRHNLSTSCQSATANRATSSSCMDELAYYLYNTDLNSDFDGKQNVRVHTIGGFIGGSAQTTLDKTALNGGGISENAQDYDQLLAALTKIFDDISSSSGTFVAPSISVSSQNSLRQLDEVYYALFKPEQNINWSGNVKRYRIDGSGTLKDANGVDAIDVDSGTFKDDARSYWTPSGEPDGNKVTKGGLANKFTLPRNIYSNIVSGNLTSASNIVHENNSNITKALFDVNMTNSEFDKLVQWARGVDVEASSGSTLVARQSMEDPLHSEPVVLNYGPATLVDGKEEADATLFVGTNAGYLHAFNTNINSPKEQFAFIPKELLPVTAQYYRKAGLKAYGLDGPISVWHSDTNVNRIVDDGERAILYIGMRRGGSSYYALDVSLRDQPKLLWQINGKDHPSTTSGFEKLGQTWSKMMPISVSFNGQQRQVLVFGGGYDDSEDDRNQRQPHAQGNAIYMVDALTGSLLWSASDSAADLVLPNMTSSIAGNLVPIDDTGDGLVDIIYAADTGGRIWRVDLNQSNASGYASGGVIADLGKDASVKEHVRFYNTPDVSYVKRDVLLNNTPTEVRSYQIAIGSGFRAHPLNEEASDNFFVIYDNEVSGPPTTYKTMRKANLANYRNRENEQEAMLYGFYFAPTFQDGGEKFLTKSLTVENNIFVTSYRPTDTSSRSNCEADIGLSRLYVIPLDGGAYPDGNDPGEIYEEDPKYPGPIPPPIPIFPNDEQCTGDNCNCKGDDCKKTEPCILIGNQCIDSGIQQGLRKTYWEETVQ